MFTYNKTKSRIFSVFLCGLLSCVISLLCVVPVQAAFADENTISSYSDVLTDLSKDPEFNAAEYVSAKADYSIQVIQIAESVDGELFIYTYQPCQKTRFLVATLINMALTKEFEHVPDLPDIIDTDNGYFQGSSDVYPGGSLSGGDTGFGGGGGGRWSLRSTYTPDSSIPVPQTKFYALTLLSSSGTLCKYKVNDFTASKDKVRYYNISSILRAWDSNIDGLQTGDQHVTDKAYPVGLCWTAHTVGSTVVYDAEEIEVVTVTDQMVGFRRYNEGFKFQGSYSCDSHFLAFSCDHEIDQLISANISFSTRDYTAVKGSDTKYAYKVTHSRTLYDYQNAGTDSDGWFNDGDYVWDRMSSVTDYVTNLRSQGSSMTNEEVETLSQYDWILCFYESEYKCEAGGKDVLISALLPFGFVWTIVNACTTTGTVVTGVSLMQLEFKYQGEIYNLGVVSDRQSGSGKPTNDNKSWWERLLEWLADNWYWIVIGLVVIVLIPILCSLFPVVLQVVLAVFKGLWWLVCLPFKGIAAFVRKIKDKRDGA